MSIIRFVIRGAVANRAICWQKPLSVRARGDQTRLIVSPYAFSQHLPNDQLVWRTLDYTLPQLRG